MKCLGFLCISIITMGYLKAEPSRFENQLPLFKATRDGTELYLFGMLPNTEGKLDMDLLRESGILGLLEECDHLITEFMKVELEKLFNPYIAQLLTLEEKINRNYDNNNYDEYKKRMKHVVSGFMNFELEKYIQENFSHSISHLHSDLNEGYMSKIYVKLFNQSSLVRDLLYNYRMSLGDEEILQVYEQGEDAPKFIKLQYLLELSEKREIALTEAYLNMNTDRIAYYMLGHDLPVAISLKNHNELLKLHISTVCEWINKIESHLNKTNQKTFIALDLMHLFLPEKYGINVILELQKKGFETKQLSVSDLHG